MPACASLLVSTTLWATTPRWAWSTLWAVSAEALEPRLALGAGERGSRGCVLTPFCRKQRSRPGELCPICEAKGAALLGSPSGRSRDQGTLGSDVFGLGLLPLLCSSIVRLSGEPPCLWTELGVMTGPPFLRRVGRMASWSQGLGLCESCVGCL